MHFQDYCTEEPFQWFFRKPVPVEKKEKKKQTTQARGGGEVSFALPILWMLQSQDIIQHKTPSTKFPSLSLPCPHWEIHVDSKDCRKELGGSAGTN